MSKRRVGSIKLGAESLEWNTKCIIQHINTYSAFYTHKSKLPVIHLQWFADDDEDAPGKTEQPTEHKLSRLREEGQVVKSQELISALGLFLPALLLLFLAPSMLRTCVEMIRFFLTRAVEMDPTKDVIIELVFLRYFAVLVWPILTVAVIAALLSNILQVGFLFTAKSLVPNFSRTLPRLGQYFRRIFSIEGFYNFFKSLLKIAIIGVVTFILIYSERKKLLNLQKLDIFSGLSVIASIAIKMLLISAVLMLAISIPDYLFQRWRFRERNKMTRYEIKEEMKMYEADPQVQARIRGRFRDLLRQNISAAVPKADVVITNPTHLAIALQYEQRSMPGPMVVAIGADEMAARIRNIAQEHEVPLVENKSLAWALYRETNVGDIIPVAYWNTVALILSKVWHLNEERRRKLSA
ncbi:MAG: flagellar biosynthesis protein FlhB [Treponema sp.]|nr:flagellar biosynthesis protein FlhB [Treponema sp.]